MSDLRKIHFAEIRNTLIGKRAVIHDRMRLFSPCTPRELSEQIGWDKCSTRPRCTELLQAGLLETTGIRRNGEHELRFVPLAVAEARAREVEQRAMTAQQMPLFV